MAASLETDNQNMIGRKVECCADHGAFKPCQWCGCKEGVLHEGGVHAFGIACAECGRKGRWVSGIDAVFIRLLLVPEYVEVTVQLPSEMVHTLGKLAANAGKSLSELLTGYLKGRVQ